MPSGKSPKRRPTKAETLPAEVSLRASITDAGLTVGARSRALAAADHLIGGIVGLGASYIEGMRRRAEARTDVTEMLIRADGDRALEALSQRGNFGAATANRFILDQERKQANREAIWVQTERFLPISSASTKDDDCEKKIDSDWMNIFSRHAEDASTEHVREIFSRLLAGEISDPGTFSKGTLRIISELDHDMAKLFQDALPHFLGDCFYSQSTMKIWQIRKLTRLSEAGLISLSAGNSSFSSNNDRWVKFLGEEYGVMARLPEGKKRIVCQVTTLTLAGRQISKIMERDELATARRFASELYETAVEKVEVVRIVDRHTDAAGVTTINVERIGPAADREADWSG